MNKKEMEKEILFTVYERELIENYIVEDETPDFILTNKSTNRKIGIEITTLYRSQASPILNCDKFSNKFINQNKPGLKQKNKKPKFLKNIGVAKIEGDAEGPIQKDYIIYEISNLKDYLGFFETRISNKNKNYLKGYKNLEFTNLIAKDEDNFFENINLKVGDLYNIIRQCNLFNTIINSNFQEIYYLTTFSTGTYCIPLKQLIFISEFEIFKKFWETLNYVKKENQNNFTLILNNFCVCLIHLGFKNIYLLSSEGFKYLVFGNTYWKIDSKSDSFEELEFLELKLLEENKAENILKNHENYKEIYNNFLKFRENLFPVCSDDYFRKIS